MLFVHIFKFCKIRTLILKLAVFKSVGRATELKNSALSVESCCVVEMLSRGVSNYLAYF